MNTVTADFEKCSWAYVGQIELGSCLPGSEIPERTETQSETQMSESLIYTTATNVSSHQFLLWARAWHKQRKERLGWPHPSSAARGHHQALGTAHATMNPVN